MSEWIRVEDMLPEEGQDCLMVEKDCYFADSVRYAVYENGEWHYHVDADALLAMTLEDLMEKDYEGFIWMTREATHWMPLPKPPPNN